jgi:PhnB protein
MPERAWSLDAIEAALTGLPRPEFRARLRAELTRAAQRADVEGRAGMTITAEPVPAVTTITQTATPVLAVRDAAGAVDFYVRAFGARETMRFSAGGRIPHARLAIGNAVIVIRDEAPAYGHLGPDQLGGSPASIRLEVDDPDAAAARAVEAGATIVLPVTDHFYGERTGTVLDPYGYRWMLTKVTQAMTVDEMQRRMPSGPPDPRPAWVPKGYQMVTPYLVVGDVPALIDFSKTVFGAEEKTRVVGSAGGYHAEILVGNSMVMIGGGAPELAWKGDAKLTPLHVYVPDVDAVFERAVRAGAQPTGEPSQREYGDRECGFVDPTGNTWYVATHLGSEHHGPGPVPTGFGTVTPCLHPLRTDATIAFLARVLGAATMMRYATPDGVVLHAAVRIGDSVVELGDAHGPHQPTPSMFLVRVPDAARTYRTALEAGATSIVEPTDRPYGRTAAVKDPFGNEWHFAS